MKAVIGEFQAQVYIIMWKNIKSKKLWALKAHAESEYNVNIRN